VALLKVMTNKMSVEELIIYLKEIELSADITACEDEEGVLNWGYIEDRHLLIQNAVYLADRVLLLPGGQRNYPNEIELRKQGYYVSCLESDGFSWLSGGIHTDKGIIAYG
jgi:hypothetical protein